MKEIEIIRKHFLSQYFRQPVGRMPTFPTNGLGRITDILEYGYKCGHNFYRYDGKEHVWLRHHTNLQNSEYFELAKIEGFYSNIKQSYIEEGKNRIELHFKKDQPSELSRAGCEYLKGIGILIDFYYVNSDGKMYHYTPEQLLKKGWVRVDVL
jgi:hypothetical protein